MQNAERVENPVLKYWLKHSISSKQVAALSVYTFLLVALAASRELLPRTALEFQAMRVLCWVLAEFVVCWMVADHIFSIWGSMRRSGMLQELSLTRMKLREVLWAVAAPTINIVGGAIIILTIVDFQFIPRNHQIALPLLKDISTVDRTFVFILSWNLAATLVACVAVYCRRLSAFPRGRGEKTWLLALIEMLQSLFSVLCVTVACAYLYDIHSNPKRLSMSPELADIHAETHGLLLILWASVPVALWLVWVFAENVRRLAIPTLIFVLLYTIASVYFLFGDEFLYEALTGSIINAIDKRLLVIRWSAANVALFQIALPAKVCIAVTAYLKTKRSFPSSDE